MIGENDEIAKNVMFKKYTPIIRKEALKHYKKCKYIGLELDDFIQEGYIGLNTALNKYDPSMNNLFFTYVTTVIRRKMDNLLKSHTTMKQDILNSSLPLDSFISSDQESTFMDVVEDKRAINPVKEFEISEEIKKIKDIVYSLPILSSSILELKCNGFTNKDISTLLSISSRRVNVIYAEILKKLRFNN